MPEAPGRISMRRISCASCFVEECALARPVYSVDGGLVDIGVMYTVERVCTETGLHPCDTGSATSAQLDSYRINSNPVAR